MVDASTREKWFVWSVSLQVALETAYVAPLPVISRSQTLFIGIEIVFICQTWYIEGGLHPKLPEGKVQRHSKVCYVCWPMPSLTVQVNVAT